MALSLEQIREFAAHQLIRLLESLPSQFTLDPRLVSAVTITNNYAGPGALEVRTSNREMRISLIVSDVVLDEVVLDLRTYKLGDFDGTNVIPGVPPGVTFSISGEVSSQYRNLSGSVLIDSNTSIGVGQSVSFPISTSPLWVVLRPIAWGLQDANRLNDIALNQLNLLKSADFFADFWGRFLGVPRNAGEADADYTKRIVYETLRPRDNNKALENILRVDDGVEDAVIEDLLPHVFQLELGPALAGAEQDGCFIPGNVYNSDNFLVGINFTNLNDVAVSRIKSIVEKHKAGGTRAFYRENYDNVLLFDTEVIVGEADLDISLFDRLVGVEDAEAEFAAVVNLQDVSSVDGSILESCYYVIDTTGPEWTTQLTPMPRSKITGAPTPFTYEVVCNPPEPPFGFNIVALNTQTVSEGWELNIIPITTQTVDEEWELIIVALLTQTVSETWDLAIAALTNQTVSEDWESGNIQTETWELLTIIITEGWEATTVSLPTTLTTETWEAVVVSLPTTIITEGWES